MHLAYLLTCCFNFRFLLNILCKQQTILSKQALWTDAPFSACLAWHWPDHYWQCNWRVAWTFSRVCAGKRRTLRATVVTICSHMATDVSDLVKCDTTFRFFSRKYQIRTSKFCKVVRQHTKGMVGIIIWVLLEIYFSFQQWNIFENTLRSDKVIAMSLMYYFWGTQCILRRVRCVWWNNKQAGTLDVNL